MFFLTQWAVMIVLTIETHEKGIDMQALLKPWQRFFAKHGIECNVSEVVVPEPKSGQDFLVVWPKEVSMEQMVNIFSKILEEKFEMALFWQGTRSRQEPDGTVTVIPTPPMVHERSADAGSYAIWMSSCVEKNEDGLIPRRSRNEPMTLAEMFLYNIFMMDTYGEQFVKNVCKYQKCLGSKRSVSGGSVNIEWDLQDIKVCLRLSS